MKRITNTGWELRAWKISPQCDEDDDEDEEELCEEGMSPPILLSSLSFSLSSFVPDSWVFIRLGETVFLGLRRISSLFAFRFLSGQSISRIPEIVGPIRMFTKFLVELVFLSKDCPNKREKTNFQSLHCSLDPDVYRWKIDYTIIQQVCHRTNQRNLYTYSWKVLKGTVGWF